MKVLAMPLGSVTETGWREFHYLDWILDQCLTAPKIRRSLRIVSNWSMRTWIELCLKGHHFKQSWSRKQGWLTVKGYSTQHTSLQLKRELLVHQNFLNRTWIEVELIPPLYHPGSHMNFFLYFQKNSLVKAQQLHRMCWPWFSVDLKSLTLVSTTPPPFSLLLPLPLFSFLPSPLSFWGQVLLHSCWWPVTDYVGQANLEFTKIWMPLPPKGAEMTDVWMYGTIPDIFFSFF